MKKFKTLLLAGAAVGVLGVGVAVGAHRFDAKQVKQVKAATETTVYYAVPSEVVGTYTVKFNAKLQSDAENWHQAVMTKSADTYGGYDLYSCTYTDLYDGIATMQFQLYDGDNWVSQQQPFGSWTKPEKYNGKVYVHDDGWHTYTAGMDTYIPMRTSFFTDWTNDAGSIASVDARFWGENYSFEALAPFYRGETAEGWTGTLTSRTWKQSTQYVYFQLGGARDYDHANGHTHLVFHYGSYTADFYNNTFVENPMTLRYFKVPDDKFAELTAESDDFDMYVEVVDPATEGYGFANLGYFHVNQTKESTGDAMRYFLNHMSNDSREWEVNKRKQIFNTYFENEAQREVFFAPVSNVNDSFSTNDDFVNHWYFDHNYFNNNYNDQRFFDDAISTGTYRPGDGNMPFNNDGGFVASDALRYRFISRPFVLSGTGLVSIKMAGKASLHVIDATTKNTDAQAADLAWIDNAIVMDGNTWNMADSGFNTTLMVNHVINLEAYLRKTIQLAICDRDTSGWSAAYFDELVSYYPTRPSYKVDVTVQSNYADDRENTYYITNTDRYINSTINSGGNPTGVIYKGDSPVNLADDSAILHHVDSSDSLNAFNVWKLYIDNVRNGKYGRNVCDVLTAQGTKDFLNAYNELSNAAKQIVCASEDFQRIGSGDWYRINPTVFTADSQYNLAHTIQYLGEANNIPVVVYRNDMVVNPSFFSNNPSMIMIIAIAISLITTVGLLVFYKKKKRH